MTPQTGTALILIALFVLPGFVTLLIRERTHMISHENIVSVEFYKVPDEVVADTADHPQTGLK